MKNTNNMTFDEILEIKLEDLDLVVRTYNCLMRAGSRTVGDIIVFSEDDFLNMRNFGVKSIDIEEIKDKLKSLDPRLHLGMTKEEIHDLSIQFSADNLNQEEKEELEKMENYAKQKEAEALKAEYMVTKAQGYYDTSSKAIHRKQVALAELQKLSQEQERLQKESEQLDAQIASLAKSLGLENFENNSETVDEDMIPHFHPDEMSPEEDIIPHFQRPEEVLHRLLDWTLCGPSENDSEMGNNEEHVRK